MKTVLTVKQTFAYLICARIKENLTGAINSIKQGFKQPDKRKHFVVGFAISFLIGIFLPWLGVLTGCIAGAVKEWWDSKGHGTVDLMDFVFTCLGALFAFPITWVIRLGIGLL
ncbi:hypothetical protein EZS27_006050 [termite gut metagenome]|jgi:hypothetical protein|uniref:Uncharacterized protein n=1 Tax=termite gut metagenome TaxID=433724 RepID=A0A5J4SM86_9ZZZZ